MKITRILCIFSIVILMAISLLFCQDDDDGGSGDAASPNNECDQECFVDYEGALVEYFSVRMDCMEDCGSSDDDCIDNCLFADDVFPDPTPAYESCLDECDSCGNDYVSCNEACYQAQEDCEIACDEAESDNDWESEQYEECWDECLDESGLCGGECDQAMDSCSNWFDPEELVQCWNQFNDCSDDCVGMDDSKAMWLCTLDCNAKFSGCKEQSMEVV